MNSMNRMNVCNSDFMEINLNLNEKKLAHLIAKLMEWHELYPLGRYKDLNNNLLNDLCDVILDVLDQVDIDRNIEELGVFFLVISNILRNVSLKLYEKDLDNEDMGSLIQKLFLGILWYNTLIKNKERKVLEDRIVFDYNWLMSIDEKKIQSNMNQLFDHKHDGTGQESLDIA